jgi:DNA-binding response OmpR family regulator
MIHWRILSKPIMAAAILAAILAGLRIARLNAAPAEHIRAWSGGWDMAMDDSFFLLTGMIGVCCVALFWFKRQQLVVLRVEEQAAEEHATGEHATGEHATKEKADEPRTENGEKDLSQELPLVSPLDLPPAHAPRELRDPRQGPHQEPYQGPQHGLMNSFDREIRILLVDNDAAILHWLAHLLGDARYNVSFAIDARDALEQLQKHRFDLVIAGVMLPDVSGCELTRMIRQRFVLSELPVLLLDGRNRPEDLAAGFLAGANDVVAKHVEDVVLKARIRALIELKLSVEERLRMEGAWMKAQIQPHFIYNTLNSIASLGTTNTDRMLDLMEVFGNYLRMSFDVRNAGRVVPLERELNLVRCYLYIEEQRFGERLKVKWELDADMNVLLPPLSIQTLVENALHHGILCRSTGGCIRIRIWSYDQYTEVTVEDNGKGMSNEAWQAWASHQAWVSQASSTAKRGGGLRSIDARLKQLFGSGLNIVSSPGKGTSVSFQIPKRWS